MGGPVATILPLGCPWRPFGSLLELSWAPAALTGRSLGALWGSLWSFGSVLSLRCEASKVWVLDQLGTARAPLYSFWGVFCAREASSWVPWGAPDALWGVPWRSLGALSVLFSRFFEISRCRPCFCAVWDGARCTIRTRLRMFCKGSPNQKRVTFQTLLGHPDTHKREQKRSGRAGEGARVAPETPDSYQNGAQAPCRESVKNEKWKCQKTRRKPRLRGKNVNKHTGKRQVSK